MRTTSGFAILLAVASGACGGVEDAATTPAQNSDPYLESWRSCLQPSALAGVAFETIPNLDLEIEGVRVVTGSLGQRGPDVDASGDVFRIAAVGGELTFGVGLSAEQAWPQALAAQLNHSLLSGGRRVAALNLGTVEAGVLDLIGLARLRALGWQPWLLVLELDASRLGETSSEALRPSLSALRKASAEATCGVLVAVGAAPGGPWDAAHALLMAEAQRAGFATLDLREVVRGPVHDAQVQGRMLETTKRRIYDAGLLTAALESH